MMQPVAVEPDRHESKMSACNPQPLHDWLRIVPARTMLHAFKKPE
jgi:hypothetical protein